MNENKNKMETLKHRIFYGFTRWQTWLITGSMVGMLGCMVCNSIAANVRAYELLDIKKNEVKAKAEAETKKN